MSKITDIAPFVGYAQNEEQTERKRLRNVLKKGDLYFNSGDLMRVDSDNFIYFQDRVGDTFRYIIDIFSFLFLHLFLCASCNIMNKTAKIKC